LENSFLERSQELKRKEMRCIGSFEEDVRKIVQYHSSACVKEDLTSLALRLIAGTNLDPARQTAPVLHEIILGQQALLEPFYRRLYFGNGNSEHLAMFKEWDAERAAVQILQQACKVQKASVLAGRPIAMEKFAGKVAGIRSEVAREIIAKLEEMNSIADRDRHVAKGLDAGDIEALRPRPFPLRLLSSEAIAWFMDAASQKLLEPTALRDLLEQSSADTSQPVLVGEQ
jgi:hypothetical protein